MLLISGVHPPPADPEQLTFYDALVHETAWYAPQVSRLPGLWHGVHTLAMDTGGGIA